MQLQMPIHNAATSFPAHAFPIPHASVASSANGMQPPQQQPPPQNGSVSHQLPAYVSQGWFFFAPMPFEKLEVQFFDRLIDWLVEWLRECLFDRLINESLLNWLIDWLVDRLINESLLNWLIDWLVGWKVFFRLIDWSRYWNTMRCPLIPLFKFQNSMDFRSSHLPRTIGITPRDKNWRKSSIAKNGRQWTTVAALAGAFPITRAMAATIITMAAG